MQTNNIGPVVEKLNHTAEKCADCAFACRFALVTSFGTVPVAAAYRFPSFKHTWIHVCESCAKSRNLI